MKEAGDFFNKLNFTQTLQAFKTENLDYINLCLIPLGRQVESIQQTL